MSDDTQGWFPRLFEPLKVGNFEIRNRIVMTPHRTALSKDRDLGYFRERARGGAALFGLNAGLGIGHYGMSPGAAGPVDEWDRIAPSGTTPETVKVYDNLVIPALKERADLLHTEGARCFGQVAHLGAGQHYSTMQAAIAPSNIPDPYDALIPHALGEEEIEELVFLFAHGIRRCCEAGMDAAELHAAHNYLVMQFLSPHFNQRADQWGGSLQNRLRLPLAIIEAARRLVGDFPIGVRLGFDGDGHGTGVTIAEMVAMAQALAPHVAYISISGGTYSGLGDGFEAAYVGPWYREPAHNAAACAAVRAAVDRPVLIAGRISDGSIAESLLREGTADMIGMVRALIADPDLPNKLRTGKPEHVRMCLGMSECHHIGRHRVSMTCAINASAGREKELALVPAPRPKVVVVVGAGPAGLEASRVAALRGHKVYLCDAEREIGGAPRWLARDPNRRNLRDHAAYFDVAFRSLDIEFSLGHRVAADDVVEFGADAVIIATGGRPRRPDGPCMDGPHVVTARGVLRGEETVGHRALVVGGVDGHVAAPTIAEFLADRGHAVTLISEQVDFAPNVEDGTRFILLHNLRRKGVDIRMCTRLQRVEGQRATLVPTFGPRTEYAMEEVSVVLACGLLPEDALYRQLRGRVPELHLIGDALAPRRIMHATLEGARVAAMI